MTTGRINQHRLVQTLGQLVIQKCHGLWTWSSSPWDIWTWSLGHGPFGHGPPSDPPVLGTWPSDTMSSDTMSFGHGPWTPCLWTSSSDISHFPIHPTPPRHIPRGTASVWSRSLSDQVPGDETGTIPCYMQ
ncbi:hypothetical protein O5D80_004914 [Batrachochytrium dendrobatidis]|nr:hypothetical protein O5D80_004914 [Batrachochytrium dendrobatidis]